jgi:hypothetical protein
MSGPKIKPEAYANFIVIEKFFVFLLSGKQPDRNLRSGLIDVAATVCAQLLSGIAQSRSVFHGHGAGFGKTSPSWRIYFTCHETDAVTPYKILFNE